MACALLDLSWMKWISRPSIVVLNWWKLRLEVRYDATDLLVYVPVYVRLVLAPVILMYPLLLQGLQQLQINA